MAQPTEVVSSLRAYETERKNGAMVVHLAPTPPLHHPSYPQPSNPTPLTNVMYWHRQSDMCWKDGKKFTVLHRRT